MSWKGQFKSFSFNKMLQFDSYPVCRSPIISSRWPRPMGTRLSTALIPVCMGSRTEILGIIPGAFNPTRLRSLAPSGPCFRKAHIKIWTLQLLKEVAPKTWSYTAFPNWLHKGCAGFKFWKSPRFQSQKAHKTDAFIMGQGGYTKKGLHQHTLKIRGTCSQEIGRVELVAHLLYEH